MKLLTFYTKTHANMYKKYFLPTYEKHLSKDFSIDAVYIDTDRNPTWGTPGFNKTVSGKIPIILNKLSQIEENEYLLYSDVDIIFLNPIKDLLIEELDDNDIIFSNSGTGPCTGFIFMKNNDKVRRFLKDIINNYSVKFGDQRNTKILLKSGKADIRYKLFSSKFYSPLLPIVEDENQHLIKDVETWSDGWISHKKSNLYLKLSIKEIKSFSDTIAIFHATRLIGINQKEKWLNSILKEF